MSIKKMDARRLDYRTLTGLQNRAVGSVHVGESPETVARAFHISRATIYAWLALYRDGGWGSWSARKRGGRHPKLDRKGIR